MHDHQREFITNVEGILEELTCELINIGYDQRDDSFFIQYIQTFEINKERIMYIDYYSNEGNVMRREWKLV